jgi:hypothetical protein
MGGLGVDPEKQFVNGVLHFNIYILESLLLFFFQKKKQKALVLQATHCPNLGEADPGIWGMPPEKQWIGDLLLFSKAEAQTMSSAKPGGGVWGLSERINVSKRQR